MFNSDLFANTTSTGGYDIDNSLRFNDDDTAYLSKTLSTPTNANKYTLSMWVKLGNIENMFLFGAGASTSNNTYMRLYSYANQAILWETDVNSSFQWSVQTDALLRDPSAWYHLMFVMDSSQSGISNQAKIYINGELASTTTAGTRSTDYTNTATTHYIGRSATADYFDGYMSEVNFIDGAAKAPTDFGEFDATYGHWKPKAYTGTYGTNGFYLPFNNADTKHTITAVGDAALSTDSTAPVGTKSIALDGNGDYLLIPKSNDFAFGTGDFTIEFYMQGSSFSNYGEVFGAWSAASNTGDWRFYASNGKLYWDGISHYVETGTLSTNTWYHIALVRSNGTTKIYTDGVGGNSSTTTTNFSSNYDVRLANYYIVDNGYFNGYFDEIRVSDTARYTTNFTPSTTAFTEDDNTVLLIHGEGTTIEDASGVPGGLGNDSNGSNHWTVNNLSTSDQMLDSPTNNFATLNSAEYNSGVSNDLYEGNLRARGKTASYSGAATGTINQSSGKWYWEVYVENKVDSGSNNYPYIGCYTDEEANSPPAKHTAFPLTGWAYSGWSYERDGVINLIGTGTKQTSILTAMANGDVLRIGVDLDNGEVRFWLNENTLYSGNAVITGLTGMPHLPVVGNYNNSSEIFNFGQDSSFAGNKVAQGNADDNGIGDFQYDVPTGYLALCTKNLPAITDGLWSGGNNQAFNTVTWTGNGAASRDITNVGFKSDFTWIKGRTTAGGYNWHHILQDSVRGFSTTSKLLSSDTASESGATGDDKGYISGTATTNNGEFTLTKNGTGSYDYAQTNYSGTQYVAWNWKAADSNTSIAVNSITASTPSIASTVSANTGAGFSIVSFTTGSATGTGTVGHGLSEVPEMILMKSRTNTYSWDVHHVTATPDGANRLILNSSGAVDINDPFANTALTNEVFSFNLGFYADAADEVIAYCFHSVDGYSKVGSYTGNGSTDGTFVHCGFKPEYIMWKRTDIADNWTIMDKERINQGGYVGHMFLEADSSGQELPTNSADTNFKIDFLSNGFKQRNGFAQNNTTNGKYIYIAFAEHPFKYSTAR